MQRIFTHINQVNLWESIESASGRGSELATTVAIRTVVLELVAQFGINSILDAPCGDFNWMRHIPLNLCQPPFSLPTPLMIFSDPSDDTGANPDKSIGLWDLQTIILPTIPRWSSPQVMLTTFVRRHFNPAWKL